MINIRKNLLLLYLFIFTIFLLGFFLRAQETLSNNYLFLLDQGRDMMDVKKIVFDHKLTLIGPYTSLGGVFQGPFYYYLLAIPTFIFQGDPWGALFLMLLLSMTVLGVAFYYVKKYFGMFSACVTLILFDVSAEAIAAATYVWNPHPMWIILTAYIFVFYQTIRHDGKTQLLLWPLVTISFHFEMAFGVFLFGATLLYCLLFYRELFRRKLFLAGFFISFLFFLPQIIFDLRHDFLMSGSIINILSGRSQGLTAYDEKSGIFVNSINNFHTVESNFYSSFIQIPYFANTLLFLSVLIFILFLKKYKKIFSSKETQFMHMLLGVMSIIVVFCLLYPFPLRTWFLTGFQVFYLLLAGIILAKLNNFFLGKIILGILFAVMLFQSYQRINLLYFNPPDDGGVAKIKGKLSAVDYIYKDASGKEFGLLIFTPPVKTDAYDYLVWWRGRMQYKYIPHSKKKGIVYLLIEPDPYKSWSYKGWLETVVKDGKVMDTHTLPSGFIIQKRDFGEP